MKKLHQSGIAGLELLLVLALIAIIGFTGYFVWQSQKSTDKTLNETGKSQAAVVTKKQPTSPETSASKNKTSYLSFKEWGVKLPLTGDITDAYYTMQSGNDFATLSVSSLQNTTCSADKISLGGIERFTAQTKDEVSGATLLSERPGAVKIGSYYYSFTHTQAACGPDKTTENRGLALQTVFQQQAKYIQAD